MFERYTETARRTIFFARYEASQCGSPYIEPEHLLLGLVREDPELSGRVRQPPLTAGELRQQVEEKYATTKERAGTSVDLPLSHPSKRVLAYGAEEAERMKHTRITPCHLLLGLLREGDTLAAKMLGDRGVQLEAVRRLAAELPDDRPISKPETLRGHLHRLVDLIPEDRVTFAAQLLEALKWASMSVAVSGTGRSFSFSLEPRGMGVTGGGAGVRSSGAGEAFAGIIGRFTEKARRVLFFARYESSAFGSPQIESEHLLLGLLREDKALAHRFGIPAEPIRRQIEERAARRDRISTSVDLPLSGQSIRILEFAAQESEALEHKHVGTEHILLGLLRESDGVAGRLLAEHGLELEKVRDHLRQ
jgi:ATP-dependent Clp protease ATP-binding subunit ClpA